ncbi:MAG TPA: cytochrome c biogenesis protein [Candidatus Acidoferrales bacterium]|nr:cytochrome c biogenesis protein [Candidatus Acidoferrales bacterium]
MKRYGILSVVLAALLFFAGYAALFIAPDEATMHAIQRIFYFHASCGWAAMEASGIIFIANVAFLWKRDWKWDWLAVSAAEVSIAFWSVMLVTGPIWAHPVWGIWWTWDWRLTLTLVIWLLYIAYLVLRTLVTDAERKAIVSAVFGIFVFLGVPLDYLSIRIWRTQHPQPVVFSGSGSLDPTMAKVLFFCSGVMTLLMIVLVRQRFRLERLRHEAEDLRLAAEN